MTQDRDNTSLTILNTKIRQDAEGRYCLNDCHKASGGENKNRPSLWAENAQTKALIAEIEGEAGIPALVSIKGGSAPGTYATKELIHAYAMWISAPYHLKVIRAFDDMVQGKLASLADHPPLDARATGGIVKAVVGKALAEAEARLQASVAAQVETLMKSYDPTGGFTTDYCPIRRVIDEAVPNPRGRGALTRRSASRCRKWLIARGEGDKMRVSRETDRILFHVDALKAWMAAEGLAMARAHQDKVNGQTVMKLVPKKRPPGGDQGGHA